MARYETPGVFDVSPPNRAGADPYGRPVITGHQPMMTDPMVREGQPAKTTNVPVTMDEPAMADPYAQPQLGQSPAYTTTDQYSDPQYQPQPGGYDGNSQPPNSMPPQPEYRRRGF